MANRARQKSQRRMQIVMAVFAILVVLSMLASAVWSFSAPTSSGTSSQPQSRPTVIVITPAP